MLFRFQPLYILCLLQHTSFSLLCMQICTVILNFCHCQVSYLAYPNPCFLLGIRAWLLFLNGVAEKTYRIIKKSDWHFLNVQVGCQIPICTLTHDYLKS